MVEQDVVDEESELISAEPTPLRAAHRLHQPASGTPGLHVGFALAGIDETEGVLGHAVMHPEPELGHGHSSHGSHGHGHGGSHGHGSHGSSNSSQFTHRAPKHDGGHVHDGGTRVVIDGDLVRRTGLRGAGEVVGEGRRIHVTVEHTGGK
jgi:hypothetical protein